MTFFTKVANLLTNTLFTDLAGEPRRAFEHIVYHNVICEPLDGSRSRPSREQITASIAPLAEFLDRADADVVFMFGGRQQNYLDLLSATGTDILAKTLVLGHPMGSFSYAKATRDIEVGLERTGWK